MISKVARLFIHLYQLCLSPFLGNCCRFYPTCSNYALEAFTRHSFAKALYLSAKRLIKCHPWHPGGYDPVPSSQSKVSDEE